MSPLQGQNSIIIRQSPLLSFVLMTLPRTYVLLMFLTERWLKLTNDMETMWMVAEYEISSGGATSSMIAVI